MASFGQLAATTPASIIPAGAAGKERTRTLIFYNAHAGNPETVEVTITRGGTELTFVKATLQIKEQLVIANFPLEAGDVVKAAATDATSVNYAVIAGNSDGEFSVFGVDAAGARKQAGTLGSTTATGDLTLSSGADLIFSGTTGQSLLKIPDNLASALDITEAANSYLKFITTDSAEALVFGKAETHAVGASTAAAGTTTADAGVLPAATAPIYPTTAADDTKGVRIHANDKVTGRVLFIGNGVSNKILKVYAPSGGAINGAAGDAAFSSASGKGVIIVCLSSGSNTWLAW